VVTLLTENYEGEIPNQEELNVWANEYGQTFPVLSDSDSVVNRFTPRGEVSLPSHSLIGVAGEVLVADGDVEESDIVAALP